MFTSKGLRISCVVAGLLLIISAIIAAADQPTPVLKAIDRLARMTHVDPGDVTVVSVEGVDWPDATLGGARKGDMAIQVITPGYRVILEAKGQRYEYHTDLNTRVVLVELGGAAEAQPQPGGAEGCRADLARRLKVDLDKITVAKCEPTEFPDTSLGLPRPGRMYAQMVTPGFHVLLDTPFGQYLYAATERSVVYGGSLEGWKRSALYIQPIENEPNLNGDLVQVSLMGTNPQVIMKSVSRFYPQANGGVFGVRRTSRSGHELLYLAPDAKEPVEVAGAFDFGEATLSPDFSQFAAVDRPTLGTAWEVTLGKVGAAKEDQEEVPLPAAGLHRRLYWLEGAPIVGIGQDEKLTYYQMTGDRGKRDWQELKGFVAPDSKPYMLDKSQTLVVKQTTENGKPAVKVEVVWFTGDSEGARAVIPYLQLVHYEVVPSAGIVFICGRTGNAYKACCVDMHNGEVTETATGQSGTIKLLLAPPRSWLQFNDAHTDQEK